MQKIPFENLPSTNYPVNASNLNQLQTNVENSFKGTNTTSDSDTYNCNYLNTKIAGLLPVKKWSLWPTSSNKTITTDFNFSGTRVGGITLLAIVSGHSSTGDYTFSKIYMIRIGYDGTCFTPVIISESKGSQVGVTLTWGVNSNNYLTLTTNWTAGYIKLSILQF